MFPKYWFAFTPYQPASIAQSLACLTADPRGLKFESQLDHITFVEIDHEIIATAILPFRWFKKGSYQLLARVHACSLILKSF